MERIFVNFDEIFENQSTILVVVLMNESFGDSKHSFSFRSSYPFFVESKHALLYAYDKIINDDNIASMHISFLDPNDKDKPLSQQECKSLLLYNRTNGEPPLELDMDNREYRKILFEATLGESKITDSLIRTIGNITNH